jgi:hypothetical protein
MASSLQKIGLALIKARANKRKERKMFRFIFIAGLFVALLTIPALAHTNLGMKQSLLAPVVQVTTPFGGGSGTMVKVKGEYTYIVTNFHVIAGVMTYDAPYNKRHLLHHTKPLTIVVTTYNGDSTLPFSARAKTFVCLMKLTHAAVDSVQKSFAPRV